MWALNGLWIVIASPGIVFSQGPSLTIGVKGNAEIDAGLLSRTIDLRSGVPWTEGIKIASTQLLAAPTAEVSFNVSMASPNRKPDGLKPGEGGAIEVIGKQLTTDVLDVRNIVTADGGGVIWAQATSVNASNWSQVLGPAKVSRVPRSSGVGLQITTDPGPSGLIVTLHYVAYPGQPAIRKWVDISNHGKRWLKIDTLRMEPWKLSSRFSNLVRLTPAERGAESSVVSYSTADQRRGVILGNEVPSALRLTAPDGSLGYADDRFEWVLGPGESFKSEAVFLYAYSGSVTKTVSADSTPLDRVVEGRFQHFLHDDVGLITDARRVQAPQFSNWTTFGTNIDDALIRQLADIAQKIGFRLFELEEGWQRDSLGTEVDLKKFPDLLATTQYIRSKGMLLGMWVGSYRTPGAKDFAELPDSASLPKIRRMGGLGMSFASSWKHYFAQDLAELSRRYGATYFKEDFSDVRFGDIAGSHESRTRKESLLRGLRGLLDAQDELRKLAPNVAPELTHEIYWGTPGVPCDLAVLQHAQSYHIPPNDYSGSIQGRARSERGKTTYADLTGDLLRGTFNARQRFYDHRGLPMYAIEYYGVAAFSADGSLTTKIQDRQVASWLMGAPAVYSGDLRTLSAENIAQYRNRFDSLARLDKSYGIYGHFQFSGVPAPTDTNWHWWGKLNEEGFGAVVVLRGDGGPDGRSINIPWVKARNRYRVQGLFSGHNFGTFSGTQLQQGKLRLNLGTYDQELIELAPAAL